MTQSPFSVGPQPVDMSRRTTELRDLRWGMFVCWSFSTYSGTEWTPGVTDVSFFRATDADVDQWVRTAKEAGMGYFLFLAKHHDGFCLWDTQTTDRKITRAPLARDLLAEVRSACDRHGLKLAIYYSEADWTWPGAVDGGFMKGGKSPELKKAQLQELLTGYGPVEYLWMDHAAGDGGLDHEETFRWCKRFQPGCLVGFNNGTKAGDIRLKELGRPGPTQEKTGIGEDRGDPDYPGHLLAEFAYPIMLDNEAGAQWFYTPSKHEDLCHPAEKLYADYLGAVKHGNIFSLCVGPDYKGKLRAIDVATLRKVGRMIRNPSDIG
jgi:alpha-L-fucosidase